MPIKKTDATKKRTVKKAVKKDVPLDPAFLTEYDRYLFGEGRNYKIYQKMGAHRATLNEKKGMHFAVWAPHARAVAIVCE